MLQFLRQVWRRLWGHLRYCGAVHYLAGGPNLPPPLTPEQEKALLDRMAAGDAAAREELITHNLRLVVYLAKKYENSGVPAEDLVSIGTIGLIKAVNTFKPDRGSRLATYAAKCVENEILMLLRSHKKYSREVSLYEPIGVDKDGESIHLVDVIQMENEDVLEQMILDQDVRELYQAYKTCLNDNEKQVVRMRYGLFGGKEYTQREIAQAMGLSRSYISRIEKRGLEKIGKEMRKI